MIVSIFQVILLVFIRVLFSDNTFILNLDPIFQHFPLHPAAMYRRDKESNDIYLSHLLNRYVTPDIKLVAYKRTTLQKEPDKNHLAWISLLSAHF